MTQQSIIWRGDEQDFTSKQMDEVSKLLQYEASEYQCHKIVKMFVPNLAELLANDYVKHHIDGNHENNHPSNLMLMTRSTHSSLHNRQVWSKYSKIGYDARCENISKGTIRGMDNMSLHAKEVRRLKSNKSQCNGWGNGAKGVYVKAFLKTRKSLFTMQTFQMHTGYADPLQAIKRLQRLKRIGIIGVQDGMNYYKSLICEV